jgi:hypothetical protein
VLYHASEAVKKKLSIFFLAGSELALFGRSSLEQVLIVSILVKVPLPAIDGQNNGGLLCNAEVGAHPRLRHFRMGES